MKVHGKRETVIGTASYLLSHATQRVGLKRFNIVSYFGVCANKKMKSRDVEAVHACLVCASVGVHNVMKRVNHWGKEFIATNLGDPEYKSVFASDEFDGSNLLNFPYSSVERGGGGVNG